MSKSTQRAVSADETTETSPQLSSEKLCTSVVSLALDQKSLDTVAYDVTNVSSIADFIVIVSGTSARHVKGICDKIRDGLRGIEQPRIEGYEGGEWIVMDFGNVVTHIFFEPKRQHYEFDSLFDSYSKLELDNNLQEKVRKFKTGLHSL